MKWSNLRCVFWFQEGPIWRYKPKEIVAKLRRGLRVIIGLYCPFKRFVISSIFKNCNNCFGGESMADGISSRSALAVLGPGTGAVFGILSIRQNLFVCGH